MSQWCGQRPPFFNFFQNVPRMSARRLQILTDLEGKTFGFQSRAWGHVLRLKEVDKALNRALIA